MPQTLREPECCSAFRTLAEPAEPEVCAKGKKPHSYTLPEDRFASKPIPIFQLTSTEPAKSRLLATVFIRHAAIGNP